MKKRIERISVVIILSLVCYVYQACYQTYSRNSSSLEVATQTLPELPILDIVRE